ncbi:MAG: response regulator transcription factor [Treponema sp.]|nr:response regulator transcription factor [Treponema sp.]
MILCVEDDTSIRDLMIYALNSAGFEAKGLGSGGELFEEARRERPRLIMLDIMLPGEDGIEILRRLRSDTLTSDIPVIMATAKGTEYDKAVGLDLGADDYLAKPFGMMEMVSRVRAVLRRSERQEETRTLKVGLLTLSTAAHSVTADGRKIQLTLKEFEILRHLMENLGMVLTRDRLLETVWGMDYAGETRTVDVHIGTLRTKLGSCGDYIETVRGVGYRMEAKE